MAKSSAKVPSTPELAIEVAELRRELGALRSSLDSLTQVLGSLKESGAGLFRDKFSESSAPPIVTEKADVMDKLCQAFVDTVSTVDIAEQVFSGKADDSVKLWTIVGKAPSKKTALATYNDQMDRILILQQNMPVDIEILTHAEAEAGAVPKDAVCLWQR